MEIIGSREVFKRDGNRYKFSYLLLIVKQNGQLYIAKCLCLEPDTSQLFDKAPLQTEDRGPELKSTWKLLDSQHDYYVKKPDLWAYTDPNLEQHICREVKSCEILKAYPHPNLADYKGCQSIHGRVSGICFQRYVSTLEERVNPGHLSKSDFLSSDRLSDTNATNAVLDGVLAGIQHLHSLNIVHNDITPSNIMLKEDGTPVIIDFGSCQIVGASLQGVPRTHGWHNEEVDITSKKNDIDAFTELKTWLTGLSRDEFLYKTG